MIIVAMSVAIMSDQAMKLQNWHWSRKKENPLLCQGTVTLLDLKLGPFPRTKLPFSSNTVRKGSSSQAELTYSALDPLLSATPHIVTSLLHQIVSPISSSAPAVRAKRLITEGKRVYSSLRIGPYSLTFCKTARFRDWGWRNLNKTTLVTGVM